MNTNATTSWRAPRGSLAGAMLIGASSALVTVFAVLSIQAWADSNSPRTDSVPRVIPYEGVLEWDGQTVTGEVDMEFTLYETPDGGEPCWVETWSGEVVGGQVGSQRVTVYNGRFAVELGRFNTSLEDTIRSADTLYLGVKVKRDQDDGLLPLAGRQKINPVPYAMWSAHSTDLNVANSLKVASFLQVDQNGRDMNIRVVDSSLNHINLTAGSNTGNIKLNPGSNGQIQISRPITNPNAPVAINDVLWVPSITTNTANPLVISDQLSVNGTNGSNGDLTTTRNVSVGGNLTAAGSASVGTGLTVGDGLDVGGEISASALQVTDFFRISRSSSVVSLAITASSNNHINIAAGSASGDVRLTPGTSGQALVSGNTAIRDRLYVFNAGFDADLGSDGNLLVGPANGENITMDGNEVMARNNGVSSPFYIQNYSASETYIGPSSGDGVLRVRGDVEITRNLKTPWFQRLINEPSDTTAFNNLNLPVEDYICSLTHIDFNGSNESCGVLPSPGGVWTATRTGGDLDCRIVCRGVAP